MIAWLASAALAQDPAAGWVRTSNVVLNVRVVTVGSTSMPGVPPKVPVVEARVEAVLVLPSIIRLAPGDPVTIAVADDAALKAWRAEGHYTVFATGWIAGDQLAVREVGHQPTTETDPKAPATRKAIAALQQAAARDALRKRLTDAELVVVGKVVSVDRPAPATGPPTEHEASWRRAVLQVDTYLRGTGAAQIAVFFPDSRDVQWAGAPQFAVGQQGVFLLNTPADAGDLPLKQGDAPLGLESPANLLPTTSLPDIRAALGQR